MDDLCCHGNEIWDKTGNIVYTVYRIFGCKNSCHHYTTLVGDDIVMMTGSVTCENTINKFWLFSMLNWCTRCTSIKMTVYLHKFIQPLHQHDHWPPKPLLLRLKSRQLNAWQFVQSSSDVIWRKLKVINSSAHAMQQTFTDLCHTRRVTVKHSALLLTRLTSTECAS